MKPTARIIKFRRGARRPRRWNMGLPPRKRPRRRGGTALWLVLGAAILIGPSVVDAASLVWRQSSGCKVWAVIDGDTVRMICPREGSVSGRVLGYDTPEFKARCIGELAKAAGATYLLRWQLWTAREVAAHPAGRDRYDRVLVRLTMDGESPARRLIGAGLARPYAGGRRDGWCGAQDRAA